LNVLLLVFLVKYGFSEIYEEFFILGKIQNIRLTPDKELNTSVYGIYRSYGPFWFAMWYFVLDLSYHI